MHIHKSLRILTIRGTSKSPRTNDPKTIDKQLTPSPPTKSLGFGGIDSRRLLILKGGNYHIHIIV